MANLGLHIIKFPSGKFGFVGDVPSHLSHVQVNGEPLTEHQIEVCRHCGPGLLGKKIKSVVFETKEDAEKALAEYNEGK